MDASSKIPLDIPLISVESNRTCSMRRKARYNIVWMISPCHKVAGLCPKFPAYIQQYGFHSPAGCSHNGYFQTITSSTGGQGSNILIGYQGNPIANPPIGRVAHLLLECDPQGTFTNITDCQVQVEREGDNFVYTFTCHSRIACVGAPSGNPPPPPPSPPSPTPPPPPGPCECTFDVWYGSTTCQSHNGISKPVYGGQCNHYSSAGGLTGKFQRLLHATGLAGLFNVGQAQSYSVNFGSMCETYQLYQGDDCIHNKIGDFHPNKCEELTPTSSAMVVCNP
eukprot:TRINITY_DN68156_c5_g2_i1.p1 TRINITY_DN68156_c5_g2~~TRINITY_DN68156_c5_g2_i1.p1  ORF type:complete len:280 (-),score=27.80 TRINITY_DN68156_c5_g2_i1:76-915(-)